MLWKTSKIIILGFVLALGLGYAAIAQGMGGNSARNGQNVGSGMASGSSQSRNMGSGSGMNGTSGMGSSGVMSNGGMNSGQSMNGGAMGSTQGMDGAAMGMSSSALTVGANGTLYTLSRVLPQTAGGTVSTKLSALSSASGATLWSMVFDENWLTKPVEGPDGRLFLVAMGVPDGQSGASGSTSDQEIDSKLYIVDSSTQKVVTVTLAGEGASVPLIGGSDGTYTVYIVTFDMGYNSDNSGQAQGIQRDSTLYAFDRNGLVKFKISLDQ